jgi:hypothetical protein
MFVLLAARAVFVSAILLLNAPKSSFLGDLHYFSSKA